MNNEESAITGKSQCLTKNKQNRKVKIIGYNKEGGRQEVGQFWNDSHAEKWGKIYSGSVSQGVWSKSHWQKQRGRLQKYEARRKT